MLEILLFVVLAGGAALVYAQNQQLKKLEARAAKLSAELHDVREELAQLEGLKSGDREALDAVHNVLFRERLTAIAKQAGTA